MMSKMVIEVHKTREKAEEREQYWLAREYTVEQIKPYENVQWTNECLAEATNNTAWGENDVWVVVART
jgi:hypothetical protein